MEECSQGIRTDIKQLNELKAYLEDRYLTFKASSTNESIIKMHVLEELINLTNFKIKTLEE